MEHQMFHQDCLYLELKLQGTLHMMGVCRFTRKEHINEN